jgi:hypothetical protein
MWAGLDADYCLTALVVARMLPAMLLMLQRHASSQGLKAAIWTVPFHMTVSRAAPHRSRGSPPSLASMPFHFPQRGFLMNTICLQTNQHHLIANLRYAFNPGSMLGELLQNARRAGATIIHVTADETSISVSDDGSGIANLQSVIHIAESGWDADLKKRENAFGMGALATLYFAEYLSVHSGAQAFKARTEDIIRGDAINVVEAEHRIGAEIRLDGVQKPQDGNSLPDWVQQQLVRLCPAFPVRVFFNDSEIDRPLTTSPLPGWDTPVGRVLIDLRCPKTQWRCFLQGLPIGSQWVTYKNHIVLLNDDMIARLPDRQNLLNETEDNKRIELEVGKAYRLALIGAKERLGGREFVEKYANACMRSANADLLDDIPFVLNAWFRNWKDNPAGYRPGWEHSPLSGVQTQEALQDVVIWRIESDYDNKPTAEVFLEARGALLLEEKHLGVNHWLMKKAKTIKPGQIIVRHGAILHRDMNSLLVNGTVDLALVGTLSVALEGDSGEDFVHAVREGNTLYLTPQASKAARLVSSYVFDGRHSQRREDEDDQTLSTFITIGCSQEPAHIVSALLSGSLCCRPQPKLAGVTVQLKFNNEGRLQTVHA